MEVSASPPGLITPPGERPSLGDTLTALGLEDLDVICNSQQNPKQLTLDSLTLTYITGCGICKLKLDRDFCAGVEGTRGEREW